MTGDSLTGRACLRSLGYIKSDEKEEFNMGGFYANNHLLHEAGG